MPKVSIIMRSKDEISSIEETFKSIETQTYQDFEIINVDSGSTDGSWEVIQKYNKDGKKYRIAPKDYIPGKVLNEAIKKSSGDIIVFNNADCIPLNRNWLKILIAPLLLSERKNLIKRKEIIATFGNQMARKTATPLVRKDYERAFGDGMISKNWKFFSLATSAVKKDVIVEYPFDPDIQYSEDSEWYHRMIYKGFKIEYVNKAIVEHSHNYTLKQLYKRFVGEGKADIFILQNNISIIRTIIIPAIAESIRDFIYLIKSKEFSFIPYSFVYRFVQKIAYFNGRNMSIYLLKKNR